MTATENWAMALGQAMCAQWGIDPNQCIGIDVRWRPGEMPTALVELVLNEGVVRELLTLVPASSVRVDTA